MAIIATARMANIARRTERVAALERTAKIVKPGVLELEQKRSASMPIIEMILEQPGTERWDHHREDFSQPVHQRSSRRGWQSARKKSVSRWDITLNPKNENSVLCA